jgi:hypothetical protein
LAAIGLRHGADFETAITCTFRLLMSGGHANTEPTIILGFAEA